MGVHLWRWRCLFLSILALHGPGIHFKGYKNIWNIKKLIQNVERSIMYSLYSAHVMSSHRCMFTENYHFKIFGNKWGRNMKITVETLYNTVNLCWSTHKGHSIARPKGRGMGCLLWVSFVSSKGNIFCWLIKIELYKIFAIINRAIKGLHCNSYLLSSQSRPRQVTCLVHFFIHRLKMPIKWSCDCTSSC